MAIKRKATKKGKHDAGQSSRRKNAEPRARTPEPAMRFRSLGHQNFYETHTCKRAVVVERPLALTNSIFDSLPFTPMARGWSNFAMHPDRCCLRIVREFYANGKNLPGSPRLNRYESFVRGVSVPFDANIINSMFGMPPPPEDETCYYKELLKGKVGLDVLIRELCVEGATWTLTTGGQPKGLRRRELKPLPMEFFNYILASILPSKHCSEVTLERAFLLYGMMKGRYMDLGRILADEIANSIDGSRGIIFPSLVHKLCVLAGVPDTVEEELKPGPLLGVRMLQRRVTDFTFVPPTRMSDESEDEFRARCEASNEAARAASYVAHQAGPSNEDKILEAIQKEGRKSSKILKIQKYLYNQILAIKNFLKMKKRTRSPSPIFSSDTTSGETGEEGGTDTQPGDAVESEDHEFEESGEEENSKEEQQGAEMDDVSDGSD